MLHHPAKETLGCGRVFTFLNQDVKQDVAANSPSLDLHARAVIQDVVEGPITARRYNQRPDAATLSTYRFAASIGNRHPHLQ